MEPHFTFRNIESTEALKDHASEKLAKLEKYHLKHDSVHIIFTLENHLHNAEVTISGLGNGEQLVGHASSEDMYNSIDQAVSKLEQQVRKRKDRLRHHKGGDVLIEHIDP